MTKQMKQHGFQDVAKEDTFVVNSRQVDSEAWPCPKLMQIETCFVGKTDALQIDRLSVCIECFSFAHPSHEASFCYLKSLFLWQGIGGLESSLARNL